MAQEKALLNYKTEVSISAEEQERYNDYMFARYAKDKLLKAEANAAANPDDWIDFDDLMVEWEQWDKDGLS